MKYVLDRFSFYVLLTKLTTVLHCILLCDVIMNGPVQLAGFALSLVALICTISATFMPEWRRNDPKNEIIESVIRHQGRWCSDQSHPLVTNQPGHTSEINR